MAERWVAPPAVVISKGVIWWAIVGGGDGDDSMKTPFWVVDTPQLVAGTAALAVVEEGGAQRRRICAVAVAVKIAVPACTTCVLNLVTEK